MMEINFSKIETIIGYSFKEKMLLKEALTHSSYANEYGLKSYERLEFIGDSIVNAIIAECLYKSYPTENQGFLSKTRALIVSGESLAEIILKMNLAPYISVFPEKLSTSYRILGDIYESIIGAIYLDSQDFKLCEEIVKSHMAELLSKDYLISAVTDFKSLLIEYCAKNNMDINFFTKQNKEPDDANFISTVSVNGIAYEPGFGSKKKIAEQSAAKNALQQLNILYN